ncbi:fas-associated death domain protein [Anopheles nili]|uniref:fas-associated death domain protein n=1 Tax=Anopheles nili TaxID=185578 RepID=UPI00237B20C7|nr:fas-associated death domain protein [Anopheles nili]
MEQISVQDRAVYERLCKGYLNLKLLIQNACHSSECLERCKQAVQKDVHSRRKLSRVTDFEQLVLMLEQRNLLSLLKPELIECFQSVLGSQDVKADLIAYRNTLKTSYATVRRFHLEDLRHRDRRTLLEKEVEKIKLLEVEESIEAPTKPLNGIFLQHRDGIYSLIQREIGKKWKIFGRFLNLSATMLDEIEERNRTDLNARIYEVLRIAEQTFTDETLDQFIPLLKSALESSRRKDLKRKIEGMLEK